MKNYIEVFHTRLEPHPKLRQWLWLIGLWFLGLFTVLAMTIPIKLLIHFLK